MFSHRRVDATKGAIIPTMLTYALPLMLTTLIQGLFNAVDIAVLGNMSSPTDVASVGATSTISILLINLFIGISGGIKILIARYVGAQDRRKTQNTINTAVISSLIFGVLVTIVGLLLSPPLLKLLNCPADCYDGALLYLRIYVCGAPAILVYNFTASVITSSGDAQRPLYYMMAGGVLNVVLNIVLCLILPQKVAAVAIATVVSQLLGAVLCVTRLCRMDGICRLVPKHMRWHTESFFAILRMGLPLAITSVLYPISYLLTQPALNSFGSVAIAGTSSAGQLDCFPAAIHAAFGTAVSVFIGQNLGANKPERVKSSIFHAAWIGALSNTVVGVFLWLTGRFWLGLLIGFENVEAIDYGMGHLLFITAVYAIPTLGTVLNHSIQSFGYPSVSSVISLSCVLGFRAFWMLLIYPLYPTFPCLMFCYTATWILQALVISTLFFFFYRRFRRGKYKKL